MTDAEQSEQRLLRVRSAADVLGALQRLSERLAAADEADGLGKAIECGCRELLGAPIAVLVSRLHRAEGNRLLVATGLHDTAASALLETVTSGDVATALEPVVVAGHEVRGRDGGPLEPRAVTWAFVPLVASGNRIGTLVVGWHKRRRFTSPFGSLLRGLGSMCAAALDRIAMMHAEREERATAELLAEATRLMVSALDPDEIVLRLAKLAVPRLAPWCAVYAAEAGVLRRVALEIEGEPSLVDRAREFSTLPLDADHPLAVAYHTGQFQIVPEVRREVVEPIYSGALAADLLGSETRTFSALVVPVTGPGRVVGVMSLVSEGWAGRPDPQVIRTAEGIAAQAGVALAVAGQFQRQHETAVVLTQALLPSDPRLPGFETASRYLPAGGTVAGDWFDVARTGPDRYLVGVGDAGGHGIRAAALMAELRNAARGLAIAGHSPAGILTGLGWLVAETEPDGFATALYSVVAPASGALAWSSAGHVPPILFDGEGARFLDQPRGAPLGADPALPPLDTELDLAVGTGLVLYTDGVVERRHADLDDRLSVLLGLVRQHRDKSAPRLVELIVDRLCRDREDDCCILVLRRRR